jgi:hypothetical protein
MNKLTFLIVFVFFTTMSFGQQSESILFDSDSYRLTPFQTEKINVLLNQLEGEGCSLSIKGHTDSDGSDDYNITLSENRVQSVRNHIKSNYNNIKIVDASFFGEAKPLNNNNGESKKSINRRVEIITNCVTEEIENIQDVWPLLNNIQPKPTDLRFDGANGGAFALKNGARISIAPKNFPSGQINLKVYECLTIGDAFAYGLTTQSNRNGEGLQSSGMYRVEAFQNGRRLPNINPNDVTIYIPVNQKDFQTFDAKSQGQYTEWEARNSKEDRYIEPFTSLCQLTSCDQISIDNSSPSRFVNCNMFWCKIKSFFSGSFRRNQQAFMANYMSLNPNFNELYQVYKTTLDSAFGGQSEFANFVANSSHSEILARMNELAPSFNTDEFYAMKMPTYSWVNCDRFTAYSNFTNISIPEKMNASKDIRLYFKNLYCVMRPNASNLKTARFKRIPVGEVVTLVILKKVNDVMMMSSEDFKVGDEPKIKFRNVNDRDLQTMFHTN